MKLDDVWLTDSLSHVLETMKRFVLDMPHPSGMRSPAVLLLYGPPGCGKTTIVHYASKVLEMELVEINASVDVNTETLEMITEKSRMSSLTGRRIIFLDEVDFVDGRVNGKCLQHCCDPVIAAANDLRKVPTSIEQISLYIEVERPSRDDRREFAIDRMAMRPEVYGEMEEDEILGLAEHIAEKCLSFRTVEKAVASGVVGSDVEELEDGYVQNIRYFFSSSRPVTLTENVIARCIGYRNRYHVNTETVEDVLRCAKLRRESSHMRDICDVLINTFRSEEWTIPPPRK